MQSDPNFPVATATQTYTPAQLQLFHPAVAGVPVGPDVLVTLGLAAGVLVGFGVGWFSAKLSFKAAWDRHYSQGYTNGYQEAVRVSSPAYTTPPQGKKAAKWITGGRS